MSDTPNAHAHFVCAWSGAAGGGWGAGKSGRRVIRPATTNERKSQCEIAQHATYGVERTITMFVRVFMFYFYSLIRHKIHMRHMHAYTQHTCSTEAWATKRLFFARLCALLVRAPCPRPARFRTNVRKCIRVSTLMAL